LLFGQWFRRFVLVFIVPIPLWPCKLNDGQYAASRKNPGLCARLSNLGEQNQIVQARKPVQGEVSHIGETKLVVAGWPQAPRIVFPYGNPLMI
jgi:hypothetical protein